MKAKKRNLKQVQAVGCPTCRAGPGENCELSAGQDRTIGSRPIRVLTSGNHGVGHLKSKPPVTPKHLKYEQETTQVQARWLELSSNAKQIFTHNSSEYIQFDEPETLINAVREVYDQAGRPVAAHGD